MTETNFPPWDTGMTYLEALSVLHRRYDGPVPEAQLKAIEVLRNVA